MNGRQIRTILMIGACVVVYTTLTAAGKHITAGNADREAFAHSLDNENAGILFDAVGPESRTLRITLGPDRRDPAGCDSARATLLVEQGFLRDAYYNHGFREVECIAIAPNGEIQVLRDDIVPPAPAPPSTEPHAVPFKHDARATDARA
jgi:hypothetical protein